MYHYAAMFVLPNTPNGSLSTDCLLLLQYHSSWITALPLLNDAQLKGKSRVVYSGYTLKGLQSGSKVH